MSNPLRMSKTVFTLLSFLFAAVAAWEGSLLARDEKIIYVKVNILFSNIDQ